MIRHFDGPYYQNGAGFGGIFRGLVKYFTPLAETVKNSMKNPLTQKIVKEVVNTGVKIGSDVFAGKDFKQAAKENLRQAKKRVAETVIDAINPVDEISSDIEIDFPPPEKKFKKIKRKNINVKPKSRNNKSTIFE